MATALRQEKGQGQSTPEEGSPARRHGEEQVTDHLDLKGHRDRRGHRGWQEKGGGQKGGGGKQRGGGGTRSIFSPWLCTIKQLCGEWGGWGADTLLLPPRVGQLPLCCTSGRGCGVGSPDFLILSLPSS